MVLRLFAALYLCAITTATGSAYPLDISKLSHAEIAPFSWQSLPVDTVTLADVHRAIADGNPQQIFYRAFIMLRVAAQQDDKAKIKEISEALDAMIRPSNMTEVRGGARRWHYGYAFEGFQPGWRSGMDTFLGPLTFWLLADLTGVERYRAIALETARLGTKSPPNGGVLWQGDSGCWISEFADDSLSIEKETFVMNGHLYGLEALYILASVSGDRELTSAYECARRGTESRFNQYFMPEREWTYYQTNPQVVHPGHYALFEIGQFWSLYQITGDDFYKQAMNDRSKVFAERYPLSLVKTGIGYDLIVSAIGVPNAYWPDNYLIDLTCKIGNRTIRGILASPYDRNLALADRLVPSMPVDAVPSSCRYAVKRGDFSMPLYEQTVFEIQEETRPNLSTSLTPSYDAKNGQSGSIVLNRTEKLQEGRLSFDIKTTFGFNDIAAISLTPSAGGNSELLIYGEDGTYTHREYRDLMPGCENLILFTKIGFDDHTKLKGNMTSVVLRVSTAKFTEQERIVGAAINILHNPAQIRGFLREKKDACINMQ